MFMFMLCSGTSGHSISLLEYKVLDSSCYVPVHCHEFVIIFGIGSEFREHGFFGRMFYILLFAGLQRQKYYFAWKLGIHCDSQMSCFFVLISAAC